MSHPAESSAQRLCQRGPSYQCSIAHRRPRLFSLCLEKKALRVLFLTHNPHSFAKVRSPPTGHHLPPAGCAENRRLAAWPSTQWPKEPSQSSHSSNKRPQAPAGGFWVSPLCLSNNAGTQLEAGSELYCGPTSTHPKIT